MNDVIVIDQAGVHHDWAWLQENYGDGLVMHTVDIFPRFRLTHIYITEGPTNLTFDVKLADGSPAIGQPVAYNFPTMSGPSSALPAIPSGADKAGWMPRACIERCDPDGKHNFQIGADSWIKGVEAQLPSDPQHDALIASLAQDSNFGFYYPGLVPSRAPEDPEQAALLHGKGPYSVQVISPSTASECLEGVGWLGGTNHRGPCRFLFVEETKAPDNGGGDNPPADSSVLKQLTRIADALEAFNAHIGVIISQ